MAPGFAPSLSPLYIPSIHLALFHRSNNLIHRLLPYFPHLFLQSKHSFFLFIPIFTDLLPSLHPTRTNLAQELNWVLEFTSNMDFGGGSMTIEARLVDQRRDTNVGHVAKIIRKKKFHRRTKRPTGLQRLFVSCKEVFRGHGIVPSPSDVQKLCHILGNQLYVIICCDNLGSCNLMTVVLAFGSKFSIGSGKLRLCMFFLPATAVIPLHNHPGMTVFSKLLRGTMHIKAYDWVDPVNSDDSVQPSQPRLARLKADSVFTAPCDTSVLYPTSGGNIHAFTAITPCVVLDVMGPPYSKDDGRDCSYYRDIPYNALSNGEKNTVAKEGGGDSYGWLEEIEMPEDSQMDGIEYLGPPISEFTS
ncbi:unnamed protein product [Camellia sinensis]